MAMERAARLLIVNADDFGLAPGVTQGILELAQCGAVTSTSTMINLPGSKEAVAAARGAGLDMGLHLNICLGAPLWPPRRAPRLRRPDLLCPARAWARPRPTLRTPQWRHAVPARPLQRALLDGVRARRSPARSAAACPTARRHRAGLPPRPRRRRTAPGRHADHAARARVAGALSSRLSRLPGT